MTLHWISEDVPVAVCACIVDGRVETIVGANPSKLQEWRDLADKFGTRSVQLILKSPEYNPHRFHAYALTNPNLRVKDRERAAPRSDVFKPIGGRPPRYLYPAVEFPSEAAAIAAVLNGFTLTLQDLPVALRDQQG